jgi:hypothetical protein
MKTIITKEYKSGFFISEQEYRRIVQTAVDAADKIEPNTTYSLKFQATLAGGSIIETQALDDIFQIENSGVKLIKSILLTIAPDDTKKEWKICLTFQNGEHNVKSWTSIVYEIVGSSRDWAFLTASELEDRIKRNKEIAWQAILSNKILFPFVTMIVMVLMSSLVPYFDSANDSHIHLQKLVTEQQIKDPISALIELEKYKNGNKGGAGKLMLGLVVAPFLLIFGPMFIASHIAPTYIFYWGDRILYCDRRKQWRNVLWTVIILGILVSIVSAFITKKMGL